jgi:hypothetical protein
VPAGAIVPVPVSTALPPAFTDCQQETDLNLHDPLL